jgi:transglutaminase-like putative cysteine protease
VKHTPRPLAVAWRIVAVPVAIALAAVGAIAASRVGFPLAFGAMAGAAAALLGVFALPSLSTRRVVVVLLGVGGLGALRHASFSGTDTSVLLVCWAAATLVALLLVDRAASEQVRPLAHGAPLPSRTAEVARAAIATAVIASVVVVALGPTITDHLGRHVWPGIDPSFGDQISAPSSLTATDHVDMTERPRLSDRVVFTVDAPRAQFWRGQTFDVWDGSTWTQSQPQSTPLARDGNTATVTPDPVDVGATTGATMRQTYRVETPFSNVVFAAPSPVSVETDKVVAERADGTLTSFTGYGKGATYTVTSRSLLPTAAALRATNGGSLPGLLGEEFGRQDVHVTERVQILARRITAAAPTAYDKVLAIEHWLDTHVTYSLNAPLAPHGVDVVDDFLFRSRVGWCEQVASSLVVLARIAGVPARLATGFVPGHRDAITGQFVVRERDAHAWAEIYFPGVGWQPFDPTASVPLAGDATTSGSLVQAARQHALLFGLLAAALVLLVIGAPGLFARVRNRLARRRASWSTRNLERLERIGRKAGRARAPAETPREYAAALALHLGEPRVAHVGETLDADGFSAAGAPDSERAEAEAVLSSLRP